MVMKKMKMQAAIGTHEFMSDIAWPESTACIANDERTLEAAEEERSFGASNYYRSPERIWNCFWLPSKPRSGSRFLLSLEGSYLHAACFFRNSEVFFRR